MINRLPFLRFVALMVLMILTGYVCGKAGLSLFSQAIFEAGYFHKIGYSYEQLRRTFPYSDSIREVQGIVPSGSRIDFTPGFDEIMKNNSVWVAMRYLLYPLNVSDQWDYLIDFEKKFEVHPQGTKAYVLKTGVPVYVRNDHFLISPPAKIAPMNDEVRPLLVFFLFSLLIAITGHLALRMLLGKTVCLSWIWYGATSYLLGLLISMSVFWSLLMAGGSANPQNFLFLWGLILAVLLWINRRRNALVIIRPRDAAFNWREGLAWVPLIVVLGGVASLALSRVVMDWDGMSHWILKAKVLFTVGRLDLSYTHNNSYPLLWPVTVAVQFILAGGMYDQMAQWTAAVLFIIMLAQLGVCFTAMGLSPSRILLATAFCALVMLYWNPYGFASANAENIYMAFATGAVACLFLWYRQRQEVYFYLGLMLTAGACLSKLEGAVLAMLIGIHVIGIRQSVVAESLMKRALRGGSFFLVILLPLLWFGWVNAHGYLGQFVHARDPATWSKVGMILNLFLGYLATNQDDLIIALGVLWLLLFAKARPMEPGEWFLLGMGGTQVIFIFFAGIGSPEKDILVWVADMMTRLMVHTLPCWLVFLASRTTEGVAKH